MTNTSDKTKPEGSGAEYKQVKVLVDAATANAFKAACTKAGISMAGELSRFMSEYSKTAKKPKIPVDNVSTRRNRRKRIAMMISQMERIRDAEQSYYDNIPENLRSSAAFESSEESISIMDEVIELLGTVYE